jgi:choline-sulfatase
MSDEHRADVAGFAGDKVVRTPVMDRLAADGVVFRNAYTPSPICIPSRQCLATGMLPNTCGCKQFGDDIPPGSMTFARRLSQYGYHTAVCGKLHHMGEDQYQGWMQRIGIDSGVSPKYIEGYQHEIGSQYGGSVTSKKWSDAKEIQRAGVGKGPIVGRDEYTVQGALHFIEDYFNSPYYDREETRPLLLKVSLLQPHYPYFTSEDKFNYYLNRVQPFEQEEVFDHPFLSRRQVKVGEDVSPRELRRATAAYYGMVETIDEMYGSILNALEQVGQNLDDWIIIYTTDHGEMLGEHGIWEKQKFFEASVRVPLIIRWPERFGGGRVVHENVNLCDLFATLCDLTGIPAPEGLDSRPLTPLLAGSSETWLAAGPWRNETVSHFGQKNLMVKWDQLKYQYYGTDMPEVLFDLERDPKERVNFVDDPVYASELEKFRQRRNQLGYGPEADPHYRNAGY